MNTNKFIKQSSTFLILALTIIQSGCSTMSKSIGLGSAVGAGAGAALGGIVDPGKNGEYRTRNVIIGAGLGAMAGGFTAASIHENTERDKELSFLKGKEEQRKNSRTQNSPSLQQPKVEAIWVESKVTGNRYIEGHFEYIITEPTRWETP